MKERVALSQPNQREGQKLEALLRMREVKIIPEPSCEGCAAEINVAVYLR